MIDNKSKIEKAGNDIEKTYKEIKNLEENWNEAHTTQQAQ